MRTLLLSALFLSTLAAFGQQPPGRFDGVWNTTLTCEAKGGAMGYTMRFLSTVTGDVLHGERGVKDHPAYLAIDGKIAADGAAKLTANGNTASSQYTHGPIKTEGEEYSYDIKAQFTDTEGKGERNQGLGIVGRPCHYFFEKQPSPSATAKP